MRRPRSSKRASWYTIATAPSAGLALLALATVAPQALIFRDLGDSQLFFDFARTRLSGRMSTSLIRAGTDKTPGETEWFSPGLDFPEPV